MLFNVSIVLLGVSLLILRYYLDYQDSLSDKKYSDIRTYTYEDKTGPEQILKSKKPKKKSKKKPKKRNK